MSGCEYCEVQTRAECCGMIHELGYCRGDCVVPVPELVCTGRCQEIARQEDVGGKSD